MPTRRQIIASAGTVVAGGTAVALYSQEANAQVDTVINGLHIPNTNINSPVEDLQLSVDAQYVYDVAQKPSRVILRLEAKRPNGEYTQIDATEPNTLPKNASNTITLNGSIMSLNGLQAGSIRPENTGESNTHDIEIQLTLQVYVDRDLIGTADANTSSTLTATREQLSLSASIGGDGEIDVITQS